MAGRPVGLSKPIPMQNVQAPNRLYRKKERKRERERGREREREEKRERDIDS